MSFLLSLLACGPKQAEPAPAPEPSAVTQLSTRSLSPTPNPVGTKVAAGGDHTCVLGANGSLSCWGSDKEGFLSQVPSGTGFIDVDVEDGLGCALRSGGTPVCWGRDDYSQRSEQPPTAFEQIRTDWSFACGLGTDKRLTCWGSDLDNRSTPPSGTFSSFDVNYAYGCAVRSTDMGITCWGGSSATKVSDAPTSGRYRTVTTGDYHACALGLDGSITCWGELGGAPPGGSWTGLVSGFDYSCALDSAGYAACWGKGAAALGTPQPGPFTSLAAGDYHVCGLTSSGTTSCWGKDDEGQLGGSSSTVTAPSGGSDSSLVGTWTGTDDSGWRYTLTLRGDSRFEKLVEQSGGSSCSQAGVWAYGDGELTVAYTLNECNTDYVGKSSSNPLRDKQSDSFVLDMGSYQIHYSRAGDTSADWLPGHWAGSDPDGWTYDLVVQPGGAFMATVTQGSKGSCNQQGTKKVSGSEMHTTYTVNECAPSYVGQTTTHPLFAVTASGFNQRMGDYDVVYRRVGSGPGPTSKPGATGKLDAGGNMTCSVGDSVVCWGLEKQGATTDEPSGAFVSIDVEDGMGCGLRPNGQISCWGRDDYGQQAVPSGSFVEVRTDWSFACGRRSDGTLSCWGSKLGGRSTPVSGAVSTFDINYAYGCAVRTDGSLACWGADDRGQSRPPSGSGYVSVSTGDYHACALKSDGQVSCWGEPANGGPPSGVRFKQVEAGMDYTCGITTDGGLRCWGAPTESAVVNSVPSGRYVDLTAGDHHACAQAESGGWSCWGMNDYGQLNQP